MGERPRRERQYDGKKGKGTDGDMGHSDSSERVRSSRRRRSRRRRRRKHLEDLYEEHEDSSVTVADDNETKSVKSNITFQTTAGNSFEEAGSNIPAFTAELQKVREYE